MYIILLLIGTIMLINEVLIRLSSEYLYIIYKIYYIIPVRLHIIIAVFGSFAVIYYVFTHYKQKRSYLLFIIYLSYIILYINTLNMA